MTELASFLVFDTETSTVINDYAPLTDPGQPTIVQLGMLVCDDQGKEITSINLMVNPGQHKIEPGAMSVHGISNEKAKAYGVPLKAAMALFCHLVSKVEIIVAHNIEFDLKMIEICLSRIGHNDSIKVIRRKQLFDTQEQSKDVLKIPATQWMVESGRYGHKPPKLEEAYKFFTGKELVGAHDALIDTRACREVYMNLRKDGSQKEMF